MDTLFTQHIYDDAERLKRFDDAANAPSAVTRVVRYAHPLHWPYDVAYYDADGEYICTVTIIHEPGAKRMERDTRGGRWHLSEIRAEACPMPY